MPAKTLSMPASDYLGDPNRTTSEIQTGIDQLLDYVVALKAEIDALPSQTMEEGAIRALAALADDQAATSRALLSTPAGVLATIAAKGWSKSTWAPQAPRQVWSGSSSFVPISALSERGSGFYIIRGGGGVNSTVYIYDTSYESEGGLRADTSSGSGSLSFTGAVYNNLGFALVKTVWYGPSNTGNNATYQPITNIYKI